MKGAVLALAAGTGAAQDGPPDDVMKAVREYWRHAPRYGCLCCSVSNPAPKAAAVPGKLGGLPVLTARLYDNRARLGCFCAAGEWLWAADDLAVYQIDVAGRRLRRTFTPADGLPDAPVRQLLAAGRWLWIVAAGRLSRLDVAAGKIDTPSHPAFAVGRMARGPAGTFLVTEREACRWDASAGAFESLGAYPGQARTAQTVRRGFWQHQWPKHFSSLLRAVVVGRDALYVLAGNTLSRHTAGGGWRELARDVWRAELSGKGLWAMTTSGVLHCDGSTGKVTRYAGGKGPAPGRPVDLAVTDRAVYLLVEPRFDKKAKRFGGGGVSRLDLASGRWTVTDRAGKSDISFADAVVAAGGEVVAGVRLAGAVEHRSLHPGMAHVRRHVAKITGLALAVGDASGGWRALPLKGLDDESVWVMGQRQSRRRKPVQRDGLRPRQFTRLAVCGDRLWAAMRTYPANYYGGYGECVQCVARRGAAGWSAVAEPSRVRSTGLAGEQPDILCLTATHGSPVVLGYRRPRVLGLHCGGGTAWIVHEGGVYAYDAPADAFRAVLVEGYRAYWQATAAAWDGHALYLGTDAGTVTRFDPTAGRFTLLGVAAGREIKDVRAAGGTIWVRTAQGKALLPPALKDAPRLPVGEAIRYDGKQWSIGADEEFPPAPARAYAFRDKKKNVLSGRPAGSGKDGPVAFVKGVFEPKVLCPAGEGALWMKVWGGIGRLELPTAR